MQEFIENIREDGTLEYINSKYDEIINKAQEEIANNSSDYIKISDEELSLDALNNVHQKRSQGYPSIGEQLDMIYHAGLGGDEFQSAIKAVKDAHPKPTGE